jgi:MFS transporter, OFA family, oxalate/formate antiporter
VTAPAAARPGALRVVAGAALLNLCLGSLYAWSVFVQPLREEFGWSAAAVSMVFATSLVIFCAAAALTGRVADRVAPRGVARVVAVAAGAGVACSAAATTLWWLLLCYAGVFGAANGLGYLLAVTSAGRVAPQRRGAAVGVAVAGYALGPLLVTAPALALIGAVGWRGALVVIGVGLAVTMLVAAQLLDAQPPERARVAAKAGQTPREVLRRREAHLLWGAFACGSFAALMSVGHAAPLAEERGLPAAWQALAVTALALGNAAGRVLSGVLSDRLGRAVVLPAVLALGSAAAVLLGLVTGPAVVLPGLVLTGFAYGGLAAAVPAATADLFGDAHLGANFGLVFTAWGVAGLLGPVVGGWAAGAAGYAAAYRIAGLVAVLGLVSAVPLAAALRR